MSEFDFYDDFKSALDNERKFELHDADWQDMTARLDRMAAKRRRRMAAAVLGVMTILLLLTSLGWWKTYQALTLIQAQKTARNVPGAQTQTDNLQQKITVVQVDTIYRTVLGQPLRTTKTNADSPRQSDVAHFSNAVLSGTQTAVTKPENLKKQGKTSTNDDILAQGIKNSSRADLVSTEPERTKTALLPLPVIPLAALENPGAAPPMIPKSAQAAWAPPLIRRSSPRSFALGVVGGPMVQPGAMRASHSIGLKLQKSLGQHLRLTAEGRYVAVRSRFDAEDRMHFHLPDAPTDPIGFNLKHLEIMQQKGELALGLRWQMRTDKRLQPYAEAGLFGGVAFDGNLKYKFENTGNGTEMVLEKDFSPLSAGGQLSFGADWRLGKFSVGAEAVWMPSFEEHFSHNGERVGLRGQVFYFF